MMHTTDDVMNMHGYWGYPENVDGRTITLKRDHQMPAQSGDELTFYDPETGMPAGKALVTAVAGQRITLDRDAAAFASAIAENRRFQCDGWEIRNCTFTDCYQRLLVQGGNGGTLRDSSFTRMGGHISLQSNFFTKNEGGICRNIRIENNSFDRVAIHPDGIALVADFKPLKRGNTGTILRDITVCGNRFLHCGSPAIAFGLVDGGLISGNCFERSILPRSAAAAGKPPDPIVLEHCRNIEEREQPPQATGVEPVAAERSAPVAAKPNVIVILADDLGYADVGFQGCRDIPTPNLDALAAGGVRCTSGYVTWPACAPSRASIIAGQDSHRFGFYDNPRPVLATDQGLPAGIMTVPRALQQQGFVTGGIGKWHLGSTPDRHPNTVGFTEWYGFLGGAHEYFPRDSYTTWCKGAKERYPKRPWPEWFVNITLPILRNREPVATQRYLTDHLSGEAVDFIKRHQRDPFFLYLAYNAPHSPYEAPEDEEAKYDLNTMADIEGVTPTQRRTYAAMVSRLDRGVGEVLAALRENGLEEKTLIFFLSDNGGGHPGPAYFSSNHPLRGYKGDLYEGGFRVPFVASWKGTLPAGTTYDQPVSSLDISATALALAGGGPAGMPLDGVNLIPHLTGQTNEPPHERLFWKHHSRGVIREGRYKLITGQPKTQRELYDLIADPAETTNLASEKTALVQRLDAAWQGWNAGMPPPAWQRKPSAVIDLPDGANTRRDANSPAFPRVKNFPTLLSQRSVVDPESLALRNRLGLTASRATDDPRMGEQQLTTAPHGHMLTNAFAWSADSRWIVYDTRSGADGSVFDGVRIERVEATTGRVEVLYSARNGACCGVVTASPVDDRSVFILGPENPTPDWQYGPAHRQGVVVQCSRPGVAENLDARDLLAPFTPGALRGGSHVHTFSGDGRLVSFTYEDAVLGAAVAAAPTGSDCPQANLRGVGVSVCGKPVRVPATHPRNHDGAAFTVLVTTLHDAPRPGSEEISKAFEEAWIGTAGYRRPDGPRQRYALACQGHVRTAHGETISEVFVVDLPDDPMAFTEPGAGPLAGTATRRPCPPRGVVQRRLTFTASRRHPGIQGPRHWLRSSPDGARIAFLMRDDDGVVQLFTVNPWGGAAQQVTRDPWNVASAFTWSPDGSCIAYAADGSVMTVDAQTGRSHRLTDRRADGADPLPEAVVFSPDGRRIAFMRRLPAAAPHNQIFIVAADPAE